ncbi:hypothetical protein PILCRDRAFT_821064 [Piloderma croceum F 1598]|uniref:Ribosomal protein/NADH dehydrogenase domain-containing protein n=1 Tax=Piloderma croceum (strain F 1598) TaxID=765440 RepID=A0A0C3FPS5_PILCF|nr:hypothetical protein PILCRDRAFT_821064 [Piloderma croceum F 1598]
MPRRPRSIPGPSRLSGILAHLTRPPRLELQSELTKLQLSYKFKNGDFGARYFVKEELPRIRYANPNLQIEVDKLNPSNPTHKTKQPLMVLEFENSPPKTLPLSQKWSTQILTELMSIAGSPSIWPKWVEDRTSRGESVYVDRFGNGRGKEGYVKRQGVWRISMRPKVQLVKKKEMAKEMTEEMTEEKAENGDKLMEMLGLSPTPIETGPPKTGVAAALP